MNNPEEYLGRVKHIYAIYDKEEDRYRPITYPLKDKKRIEGFKDKDICLVIKLSDLEKLLGDKC